MGHLAREPRPPIPAFRSTKAGPATTINEIAWFYGSNNRIYQLEFYRVRRFAGGRSPTGASSVCAEALDVPNWTVLVEFTVRTGGEILRQGESASDRTPAQASDR
jgi:hypothetical protein